MEVLSSEIVDYSMPISVLLLFLGFAVMLGLLANLMFEKVIVGVIVAFLLGTLIVKEYNDSQGDSYEIKKVIITDWNIVHEEGWEVLEQEGKIVKLKRYLNK